MWPESSSINAANLVKKSATIPEIQNFSWGIIFLPRPVGTSEHVTAVVEVVL